MNVGNLIEMARKALEMYGEADNLIREVKESIASSRAAENTDDLAELRGLLDRANQRRRAAGEDLDAALAALEAQG